jgi:predicted permease
METARKRLWLAITLPPVVWAAQGLFGWFVASHGCPGTSRPWSYTAARWAVAVATVLALAVTVAALAIVVRHVRSPSRGPDAERVRYLSMAGLVVGSSLILGVIFAGLSAAFLSGCGEMR